MTRIVTTTYRPKRPARKRKPVAIKGPVIVRKRGRADVAPPPDEPEPPAPAPAAKPAIATSISRERARLQRGEKRQAAEPDDDPEATARVRAFLDRMIRPRGP
jgi:hypothetical protein